MPVTTTSVFPAKGPRAGQTLNWFVLMFVTVGLLSSYRQTAYEPSWNFSPSLVTRTRHVVGAISSLLRPGTLCGGDSHEILV